jgi:hypothetical protein
MLNKELIHQELYDGVYYYENIISDPQRLMDVIESTEGIDELQEVVANWVDWGVEADRGTVYWYGKRKRVLLNDLDDIDTVDISEESREKCKEIFDTIFDGFRSVCDDYKVKRNIEDEVIVLNQMNVHKYKENTWMGTHHDAQEGDTRLKYSLLLYINDDYEGGELSFCIKDGVLSNPDKEFPENTWNHMVEKWEEPNDFAAQGALDDPINEGKITFSLKPTAGSILIFPSKAPYNHTAHIVKSGWKWLVPGFWIDPNGKDAAAALAELKGYKK